MNEYVDSSASRHVGYEPLGIVIDSCLGKIIADLKATRDLLRTRGYNRVIFVKLEPEKGDSPETRSFHVLSNQFNKT